LTVHREGSLKKRGNTLVAASGGASRPRRVGGSAPKR
jgi:hypothetical protein